MVMTEQYTPTINKTELAPGLVVYKDVIPSHEQLIPYIEQVTASGMVLWGKQEMEGQNVENMQFDYPNDFKDPNDPSILFEERMSLVLGGFMGFSEMDFVKSNGIGENVQHRPFHLLKYAQGTKFPLSKPSNDPHPNIMSIYYINDDFEGGEVNFPNLNVSYTPKSNELIMFPVADGFEYSVSEITSGTKFAVFSSLVITPPSE